jgi:hypothetical protein
MTIQEVVKKRGIREILHFTTNHGLLGILASGKVKSRKRLKNDEQLEFILKENTPIVKDPKWIDYVNLSISRINRNLYEISSNRWHPELWWCILSFDPKILAYSGVHFVTTNNIYPAAIRGQGGDALENLFAPLVQGRYNDRIMRPPDLPLCCPTCRQAEVLYPGELSTEYLQRIYVENCENQDDAFAQFSALGHREISIVVDLRIFT